MDDDLGVMPDPAALLARLEELVTEQQRVALAVAGTFRDLHAFGGALPVSGYTDAEWLALVGRLSSFETRRLSRIATRLPALPACDRALFDGRITLDQAGWILDATAGLAGDLLDVADRSACAIAVDANMRGDDPDVRDELDAMVRALRPERTIARMERRQSDGQRLIAQPDLDGGGWLYAELDPVGFATVVTAVEHAAGAPAQDVPRRRQRAEGLISIARTWNGQPARGAARPSVTVLVDLADASAATAGRLLATGRGVATARLSAAVVDTLACDARLLVQVQDGARPLARLAGHGPMPDATRRAVLDVDGGCRWPGCAAPVWQCDVHHVVERSRGGGHTPDNLVTLCRRHHRRLHGTFWRVALDGRTRELAFFRGRATRPTHTTVPAAVRPRAPD